MAETMSGFRAWLESSLEGEGRSPRVLWVTGMGSSGAGPRELAAMGYEVKQVGTTTSRFAAYLGRVKRHLPVGVHAGIERIAGDHLAANVRKHDGEMGSFVPDVVVGTSQGGAVAMQVAGRYPGAKFVLGAPAWKVFGADPSSLPRDTIVVHGRRDLSVPASDSMELEAEYGLELVLLGGGHTIPTDEIRDAVDRQLERLGVPVPQALGV